MSRRPPVELPLLAALLAVATVYCTSSTPPPPVAVADAGSVAPAPSDELTEAQADAKLPGINTSALTPKQRSDLVDIAGDTFCPCSGNTVAACLHQGPPCPAAKRLLELAKKLLASGAPKEKAALYIETYYSTFGEDHRAQVSAEGPSKGPADAKVQIVEFSDFQCPACRAAHPALTELLQKYPNDVRWVFRNFPLPQHEHAEPAAMAGVYAYEHGKFWPDADYFFGHQEQLGEEAFRDAAKVAGLDPAAVLAASTDPKMKAKVEADKADGMALKLGGTPSIFLNGRQFVLSPTLEYLSWTVEDELEWLSSGRKWASR